MKGTTKIGTLSLNGLAIFLTIIFVISIVTMSGNTVSVQAKTIKSQREDMSDKKAAVKKNRWTRIIQKYEKSEKVNQLIFVKYKGNSKADIILYKKANGKFKKVFACAGYVGKNGINKKREGDKKTPTGTYGFTKAFGIKSNPGSKIKYIKLNSYLYWSADRKYYKHALAIDYNKKCIYKKGAAIFLHCTESNPYTGGCVAVKEKYMKKIMKTVDKNAKICIYPK